MSANVQHLTADHAKLTQYIDTGKAPHLVPIMTAVRDYDCAFSVVLRATVRPAGHA